ncbi:hypothetical protein Z951_45100 [Streptomyces sp. PRh5]|uniref:hypothetical protein n=1 Tax=Streptomyces sp. PRh5 TaxID=1158056 RepID=UPI00044D49EE|nr:hypothetical protein [Streptomyces sp. PRh5]EXU61819.1 hypothetical protein Z951_45100 [Streptomyces sp. PRh5]
MAEKVKLTGAKNGAGTAPDEARHDDRPLGRIKTSAASEERAAQAAIQWVRGRCQATSMRILSAARVSGHLPESGKRLRPLARFVIDSGEETGLAEWTPVPLSPSGPETSEQGQGAA